MLQPELRLKDFTFQELFYPAGLEKLDKKFLVQLRAYDNDLYNKLIAYRRNTYPFTPLAVSELLLACAPILETFVAKLFGIQSELEASCLLTVSQDPIFIFKKWYVQREAKRRLLKPALSASFAELDTWLTHTLHEEQLLQTDRELAVSQLGQRFLANPEKYRTASEKLVDWCVLALTDPVGKAAVKNWVSFRLPQKLDYQNLVPWIPVPDDPLGRYEGPPATYRHRDGFKLTDHRMSLREALNEVHYCVYCHKNEGDFCSKGFPEKKNDSELKINPLGEPLTGCPLEEKISEMHTLKKEGRTIAALAMVMADNPMCPVTGHRICNDCMKACIYQKQEPVNIPQTETRVLTDVLQLPWGVEIYDLLTRWNPLSKQWVAKPYNGLKVLVMGMGPAGFSLAYHLLMEGFAVVGMDGLKIEPLPNRYLHHPVYRYTDIKEELDIRIMAGFGGVAEYGITVRWDKNFLKLIYLTLMRRPYFQVLGGVRFGGTLCVEDAWELGFDHLAIAVGAGLPRELPIPGSMAIGMRQANDFLMALQLTGAAKKASLANLQVRLPAVVIGGGLTGIDTATEVQAYYITQVEKTLERYETLAQVLGEARIRSYFDPPYLAILNEFLAHGRAVREERERAALAGETPDFNRLIREWGGVTIAYRRLLRESPAYKRNHEEITKALEEGVYYAEGLEPKAVRVDSYGHVTALVCQARIYDEQGHWVVTDEEYILPAHAIFVATGAKPNIAYEFEHRGTFQREGFDYRMYDWVNGKLELLHPNGSAAHCKTQHFGAFTSYQQHDHRVTFLGDAHPVFHGNVVKAIASAKRTYPQIMQLLGERLHGQGDEQEYQHFAEKMRDLFTVQVVAVERHSPSVIEIKVRAPQAARNFLPGQFYRVQSYETTAPIVGDTRLQTEAVAVLGAGVDKQKGILSLLVLECGASTRLFATWQPGQFISLMGPTGVRTKIPRNQETVLIVGGRLGIAQIRTVGPALRAVGNRVLYVAVLQSADEVHCQSEVEAAADKVIWVTQMGKPVKPGRWQDHAVSGDVITALLHYARGELNGDNGSPEIPLQEVDRVLVVGRSHLMREIQEARQGVLREFFVKNPPFIASVHSPMQCMLKGVCAQCLQWQVDPQSGQRTKAVYGCSWQDQPLEGVDWDNLDERLAQNRVQEILSNLWLDYLLAHYPQQELV
jgi:NADPH-dependent glutamate synthase beta subunit-like oxidoreductase/NAD(P)H-flavin reductase